jgi:hypothetical protein
LLLETRLRAGDRQENHGRHGHRALAAIWGEISKPSSTPLRFALSLGKNRPETSTSGAESALLRRRALLRSLGSLASPTTPDVTWGSGVTMQLRRIDARISQAILPPSAALSRLALGEKDCAPPALPSNRRRRRLLHPCRSQATCVAGTGGGRARLLRLRSTAAASGIPPRPSFRWPLKVETRLRRVFFIRCRGGSSC